MDILSYLKQRGIINNITNEEKVKNAILNKKAIYIGFDPSFKSFHLGNYIQIHLLNVFSRFGIKAFAILGGATGRIGDPSGKKQERALLDLEILAKNCECLTNQLKQLTKAEVLDNYSWYKDQDLFDFLRLVGKHFSINYLLEKDIIKSRIDAGISFAEVTYNLIQGYDFLWLYDNKNVSIQLGGADQWGNITTGLELIRKYHGENADAAGITINLLTKEDGTKFGKSEKGAIYLDKNITSVFEMFQFFINQSDSDLRKLFMFFSDLEIEQVDKILSQHEQNKQLRYGQKQLAMEIVSAIHGKQAYDQCLKIADALFNDKFDVLSKEEFLMGIKQFNSYEINDKTNIVDFLVNNKIVASKRIAKELIASKSIQINGTIISDANFILDKSNTYFDKYVLIKKGKKNYFVAIWK